MNLIRLALGHGPSALGQVTPAQQPQTREEQLRAAYIQWLKDHPEEKRTVEELLRDAYNAEVTAHAAEIQEAKAAEEALWAAAGEAEWDPEVLKRIKAYAQDIQTHLLQGDKESAARKMALLQALLDGEIEKHNQLLYDEKLASAIQFFKTIVAIGTGVGGAQVLQLYAQAYQTFATTMAKTPALQSPAAQEAKRLLAAARAGKMSLEQALTRAMATARAENNKALINILTKFYNRENFGTWDPRFYPIGSAYKPAPAYGATPSTVPTLPAPEPVGRNVLPGENLPATESFINNTMRLEPVGYQAPAEQILQRFSRPPEAYRIIPRPLQPAAPVSVVPQLPSRPLPPMPAPVQPQPTPASSFFNKAIFMAPPVSSPGPQSPPSWLPDWARPHLKGFAPVRLGGFNRR